MIRKFLNHKIEKRCLTLVTATLKVAELKLSIRLARPVTTHVNGTLSFAATGTLQLSPPASYAGAGGLGGHSLKEGTKPQRGGAEQYA